MKFKLLLPAILLSVVFVSCNRNLYDVARKPVKGPLETIWVANNVFFDKTEVTNFDWKDYLRCIEKKYGKKSHQYTSALPDTTVWLADGNNEEMVHNYYKDINFAFYPVVGISYEQAVEYCKWETDTVAKQYEKIKNKKGLPKKFVFRLPTKDEWQIAATASLSYQTEPYGFENIISKDNLCKVVCKEYSAIYNLNNDAKMCSAYYGSPNIYNLLNMTGNVAEMVSEKGIAMGGSWKNPLDECKVNSEQKYTKPTNWIGFRVVCEIVE